MASMSSELMPLYRFFWLLMRPSRWSCGSAVEVVHVLRRRHLQGELGVLEREEPAGAGDPVQLVPVDVDLLQQFVVDLRGALAAAHDGDAPLLLQFTLPRQVVGVVEDQPAAVHNRRRRPPERRGEVPVPSTSRRACSTSGPSGTFHGEPVHAVVVADLPDVRAEPDRIQLAGHPLAVLVVLGAQRIEVFPDVEAVQPSGLLQEVQERVRRRRVRQGHEVGHEGDLQVRRLQHHARMPVEGFPALQEHSVQPLDGLAQGREAQVEGPDADGGEVVDARRRARGVHADTAASASSDAPVVRSRSMMPRMSSTLASAFRRVNFR